MGVMARSQYFLNQRHGRWRLPWLVLALIAAAVGGSAAAVVFVLMAFLLDIFAGLTEWDDSIDFLGAIESDLDVVTVDPLGVAVELLLVGVLFWGAAIAASLVQGQPLRSLLMPTQKFRWELVRKAGAAALIVGVIGALFDALLDALLPFDTSVSFTGIGLEKLLWLIPAMLVTLVQTSGEDAFFKGFLLHRLGAIAPLAWVAPALTIAIFVSLHIGNPDIDDLWLILPAFVLSEAIIIYFIVRTGGLEIAFLLHWLNNAVIFLLIADAMTQANDLTLFVFEIPGADEGIVPAEVIGIVTYAFGQIAFVAALTMKRSPFYVERYVPPVEQPQIKTPEPVQPPPPPAGSSQRA